MVIKSFTQSDLTNVVIGSLEKTKEQIKQENYDILTDFYNKFFKDNDYIQSEYKKEYILDNSLKIKNRRLRIKKSYECEKILAFDIETFEGFCKLIACSNKKYIFNPSFYQCIKFLFYLADNCKVYRFFYGLS